MIVQSSSGKFVKNFSIIALRSALSETHPAGPRSGVNFAPKIRYLTKIAIGNFTVCVYIYIYRLCGVSPTEIIIDNLTHIRYIYVLITLHTIKQT